VTVITETITQPLPSFRELRMVGATNPVARACIELRKAEVRSTGWDVVLTPAFAQAAQGNHEVMATLAERRRNAVAFFRRPDPDYADFSSWLNNLMEDVLVTDSLAIYPHPRRARHNSLCGSDLAGLTLIDGAALEPALSGDGKIAGYRQYLHEVPRRPAEEILASPTPDEYASYRKDQLLYLPFTVRPWTPFGFSLLEKAIASADDPALGSETKTARLLRAFELPGEMLGITPEPGTGPDPDQTVWRDACLKWLAGIFNGILGNSGLCWKWESVDA
jgi:hypothetical protein